MQVKVKTFPIDIQITVCNCEELDMVWKLKTSIENKEVDALFKKMKKSANKERKHIKPKYQWHTTKEFHNLMRGLGTFTVIDLCHAVRMKVTKSNRRSVSSRIGKAIREGHVEVTLMRRKPIGARRMLKVYGWKE